MRFGTDGIRGIANAELTPELCLAVGRAVAQVLGGDSVLVGRDPRRSGPMIEAALAAGICAEGVDVVTLGVVATPTVAVLAAERGIAGVMISASHNPAADNGIKVFGAGGTKLSDTLQTEIELLLADESTARLRTPTGAAVGTITALPDAVGFHRDRIVAAVEGERLDGLKVVLDCANGAASVLGPAAFTTLGADVVAIHASPDGMNINDRCGSTHPDELSRMVVERHADLGFAFDGDADRVVAVDASGTVLDGDQLMAIAALDLKARGRLQRDGIAVTVMSNLGFRRAMSAAGIEVWETPVGDRHVLEVLDREGLSLGGEQSGHLIFRDLATTGDGVLGAVLTAEVVSRRGEPLGVLADESMTALPQVLRNVVLAERDATLVHRIEPIVAQSRARLGDDGRVLVRASGTEPLVRVMVEAADLDTAVEVAEAIAAAVADAANGS